MPKSDNNGKTILAQKYYGENNLNKFYNLLQLTRLGLPSGIKVIANEKVSTETIFDKANPNGLITINVDADTTNADFVDALNHEFRHILQHYNNFEMGFTTDFIVTDEMMADLKKNVPEIFKNEEIRALVKKGNPDKIIASRFIYYMVGGEQNAYGIRSAVLNAKPAYVVDEAGKPVIFMPWYDAKTGEGRYKTDFLASTKSNDNVDLPQVDKKRKYKSSTIDDIDAEKPKKTYKYTRKRSFTKAEAKGTNLEYFVKTGVPGDMDPDLKNLIIATTGNEDKLPKELIYAIQKGKLTLQAFHKWFRNAKSKDINEFTFELINKHIFKNDVIQSMSELEKLTASHNATYHLAAVAVLQRAGLSLDSIIEQNNVQKFTDFINSLKGTEWDNKIRTMQNKLNWYTIFDKKTGKDKRVEILPNDIEGLDLESYMRVFAMKYFDGSLAGAFYIARDMRYITRKLYEVSINKTLSIDTSISSEDGEKTFSDLMTEDNKILGIDNKDVGNDIIAMYQQDFDFGKSTDEMIIDLGFYASTIFTERALKEAEKTQRLVRCRKTEISR